MKKFLKTYLPFSRAGVLSGLAYRLNFIFFLLGEILNCFILYFVWTAVFNSSGKQNFMGFTMENMVVYLFISFLTGYLTYSDANVSVGEEIVDGSVAMRMIKPCDFDISFLFQELGNKVITVAVVFFPVMIGIEIYRYVISGTIMFNAVNFFLYILSTVFAYVISFYFNICYGFLAFFLKNIWGTSILKETVLNFLSGASIPLAFLPAGLSSVLQILPFAHLNYTPVMLYMGMYSTDKIIISLIMQIFWCAFFIILSKLIWKSAIKRLTIQGG